MGLRCFLAVAGASLLPADTSASEFRNPGESADAQASAEGGAAAEGGSAGDAAAAKSLTEKLLDLKLVKMGVTCAS